MVEKTEWTRKEAKQMADRLCEKNGFNLIHIRELPQASDYYLRYVLAYNEKAQEYVTWLLNLSQSGLALGHYFSHFFNDSKEQAYTKAKADFENR